MSPLTNLRCVLWLLYSGLPQKRTTHREPHLYSVLSLALCKSLVSCKSHYFPEIEYLNPWTYSSFSKLNFPLWRGSKGEELNSWNFEHKLNLPLNALNCWTFERSFELIEHFWSAGRLSAAAGVPTQEVYRDLNFFWTLSSLTSIQPLKRPLGQLSNIDQQVACQPQVECRRRRCTETWTLKYIFKPFFCL